MPIIKVWCLPKSDEDKLRALHRSIVFACAWVEGLGIEDENDVTCLFPADMMQYGLGTDIIIEVTGLFVRPERTAAVHSNLAKNLGTAIRGHFPDAKLVECFIHPFDRSQGYWSSKDETK